MRSNVVPRVVLCKKMRGETRPRCLPVSKVLNCSEVAGFSVLLNEIMLWLFIPVFERRGRIGI